MPDTAGSIPVRCFTPDAIAYAQSTPGVMTNSIDTPQNATINPTSTSSSSCNP